MTSGGGSSVGVCGGAVRSPRAAPARAALIVPEPISRTIPHSYIAFCVSGICDIRRDIEPMSHPTAPAEAMLISISRFISTAYSMGSSLTIGSMNPATIIEVAWSSVSPRDMR